MWIIVKELKNIWKKQSKYIFKIVLVSKWLTGYVWKQNYDSIVSLQYKKCKKI